MPLDPRVERYAPLLRFTPDERHFPVDPAFFVARARLRRFGWDRGVPDGYWNPTRFSWDAGLDIAPPAHATSPDLSRACALMQAEAPSRAGLGRNRRPNDPCNLWEGRRAGYGLELTQAFARELRGVPGSAPFLLFDRYRVSAAAEPRDVITYWFFYSLHASSHPHEGDWAGISVVLPVDGDEHPVLVMGGAQASFDDVELAEGTHPVVYVAPGSHRTACVEGGGVASTHSVLLRAWRLTPKPVQETSWSCFDGAWGRVGALDDTTGPLGPLMRRLTAADLCGAGGIAQAMGM